MSNNASAVQHDDDLEKIMVVAKKKPRPNPPLSPILSLSFGTILDYFPELLRYILPYIADRRVFNAIVASHRKIYEISKEEAYLPPWPKDFELCGTDTANYLVEHYYASNTLHNPVWSPDGTQIACIGVVLHIYSILIFDQRRGLLPLRLQQRANDNYHDYGRWVPHPGTNKIPSLKYSPDGSFLLSSGGPGGRDCTGDGLVRIWDYNTTDDGYHYYSKLQEWNIREETNIRYGIEYDISPCSGYVVISSGRHILLKDVHDNGKTIKSLSLPESEVVHQIMFSTIDGHHTIFICSMYQVSSTLKIWRPYAVGDDNNDPNNADSMSTIIVDKYFLGFALSHDSSMIAIYDHNSTVMLFSVHNDRDDSRSTPTTRKYTVTLKQSFLASLKYINDSLQFTPDDKFIPYNGRISTDGNNINNLEFWDVKSEKKIIDPIVISYTNNRRRSDYLTVIQFLPGQYGSRVLVRDSRTKNDYSLYIASCCFGGK